jgi:hypothetical protein
MVPFSVDVRHRQRLGRVLVCDTKDLIAKLGGWVGSITSPNYEKDATFKIFYFYKKASH